MSTPAMARSQKPRGARRGFTLVELLVTLAVAGVLIAVGVPALRNFTDDAQLSGRVAMYNQALNTARALAVSARRGVTLCALDESGHCTGDWNADLSLFHDDERAGVLANEQDMLAVIGMPPGNSTDVNWRGFGERRFLHVRASGIYRQNGRFTFCPAMNGRKARGRAVIVNVTGRTRVETLACP